jgi:signal transduction histidine kinase
MAAMGEILVNIAHQWRQPLNILGLIVQEMAMQHRLRQGEEDPAAKRAMEVIRQMSRTIDDFRNFFRPDQAPVTFKVNEVLSKMVDMLGVTFREQRVPIELENEDELLALGYPNEFSQAVLNILVNALDAFLEQSVPEPRVVIRLFREGERGVVLIADNAGGIPEQFIDRIFEPYFTTKGPDKGTGIGLYMAKALIANMHGSLTVRNANGGAEFRVEVLNEAEKGETREAAES